MADKEAPPTQPAYRNPLVPVPFPPMELFERGTVIDLIAKEPKLSPKKASEKLFPKRLFFKRFYRRWFIKWDLIRGRTWTAVELDEANARGQFPYRPTDLFLRMYADVLTCLPRDPLAGNVSPALLGTSGTIPLSIISTIPDIMTHYHDCIVLAEKEVFLVTNYWQPSDSVKCIARGLRELDEAVGKRGGQKIVVKVMWDRGDIHQLWHNHVQVKPSTWIPLGLPDPKEVPNLLLEVINFHRPLLGTFHQKALVVDRKIALVNSNNIQDRPNIEMMIHLEGPVVDSVYDTLLLSWHESFSPVPPTISERSHYRNTDKPPTYNFSDSNPFLAQIDVLKAAKAARLLLSKQNVKAAEIEEDNHQQHREGAVPLWWRRPSQGEGLTASLWRRPSQPGGQGDDGEAVSRPGGPGRFASLVTTLVEKAREEKARLAGDHTHTDSALADDDEEEHESHELSDIPESPRSPKSIGSPTINEQLAEQPSLGTEPPAISPLAAKLQAAAVKAAASPELAEPGSSRSSDTLAPPAPHFANGSAIEPTPSKNSIRLKALSKSLNAGALAQIEAAIDDESLIDDYKPHFIHRAHKPVPMAMVNRKPHGAPGHQDIRVPQDAAWLAGLRHAQESAFIQTPTLNAKPIVRAVVEACSRGGPKGEGIIVTLILGLGFNDKGESVPFQGGTNEEVVVRLFNKLRRVGKQDNLHVYWYTGKDQVRPLNAVHKTRNCHVKYASFDDQVAIIGNGNQDTQSWTHSQEMNVMIDDKKLVADWMDQLRTNQSSYQYGRVDTDGIWRDQKTGEELDKPIPVSCITAIRAMI